MLHRPDNPPPGDRHRRFRARRRDGKACYQVELGAEELDFLIRTHWLQESEVGDKQVVSRAIGAMPRRAREGEYSPQAEHRKPGRPKENRAHGTVFKHGSNQSAYLLRRLARRPPREAPALTGPSAVIDGQIKVTTPKKMSP